MMLLPTAPSAVTVFRRGAHVTRVGQLAATGDGWPAQVQVSDLPLSMLDGTIQVDVVAPTGPAPIAIPVATSVRVSVRPPPEIHAPPPDETELHDAELAAAKASQRVDDLEQALARMKALQPADRPPPEEGQPPRATPLHARLELVEFRRARLDSLHASLREAREQKRRADERAETLRERKRRASSAPPTRPSELRKHVTIELERPREPPDASATVQLVLRYRVPGARWAPSYTMRLDPSHAAGTLELRAVVAQATGEDWRGVTLTLSTAWPQQWTELPELRSQRIGRRQPPPPRTGWRNPPTGAQALYADYDRAFARPKPKAPPAPPPSPAPEASNLTQTGMIDLDALRELAQAEAGASPPAPAAPPMADMPPAEGPAPFFPQPMRAKRRGLSFGSALGDAVEAVRGPGGPPPPSPQTQALASSAPPPTELHADKAMLDYANLHMPDATQAKRGTLVARDEFEQIAAAGLDPSIARTRIEARRREAERVEQLTPPARHLEPTPEPGFDHAYVSDAPIDVVSDGVFHNLAIRAADLEGAPRFIAVPRESRDVFRVVSMRNPLESPLLAGPVDVYVGGKFMLTSDLELTPSAGRIELGLGVEQAIKVARNVAFEEASEGMLMRSHTFKHRVAVELANQRDREANIDVRERIPMPAKGEGIEVEVTSVEPSWSDFHQDKTLESGHVWRINVPAHSKRSLEVVYVVRVPSGHEIVGGNRREGDHA